MLPRMDDVSSQHRLKVNNILERSGLLHGSTACFNPSDHPDGSASTKQCVPEAPWSELWQMTGKQSSLHKQQEYELTNNTFLSIHPSETSIEISISIEKNKISDISLPLIGMEGRMREERISSSEKTTT